MDEWDDPIEETGAFRWQNEESSLRLNQAGKINRTCGVSNCGADGSHP